MNKQCNVHIVYKSILKSYSSASKPLIEIVLRIVRLKISGARNLLKNNCNFSSTTVSQNRSLKETGTIKIFLFV